MMVEAVLIPPSVSPIGIDMKCGRDIMPITLHIIVHPIGRQHHRILVAQRYKCTREEP